jgi:dihydroflavonol-4-reductase
MRALVTGANGFLGSHLVDLLLVSGEWEVRVLTRATSDLRWLEGKPVEFVIGDVTGGPGGLAPVLADVDVVFHAAGVTKAVKKETFDRVNRDGTEALIQACLGQHDKPSRLVLVSSAGAQGPSPTAEPLNEESEPKPVTRYGRSKLAGEQVARRYMDRLSISILRPGGIYGPRDLEFLPVFQSIKAGLLTRFGLFAGKMNLCHVQDVARAVLLAGILPEASSETFLVSGTNTDQVELGKLLGKVLGKRFLVPMVIPRALFRVAGLMSSAVGMITKKPRIFTWENTRRILARNWTIDGSKAARMLGYTPRIALEEGLAETAEWYRTQKLL